MVVRSVIFVLIDDDVGDESVVNFVFIFDMF
jgi:hypothetical protein